MAAMDGMSAKCTTEQFNLLEIMPKPAARRWRLAREAFPRARFLARAARWSSPHRRAMSHDLGKKHH